MAEFSELLFDSLDDNAELLLHDHVFSVDIVPAIIIFISVILAA